MYEEIPFSYKASDAPHDERLATSIVFTMPVALSLSASSRYTQVI